MRRHILFAAVLLALPSLAVAGSLSIETSQALAQAQADQSSLYAQAQSSVAGLPTNPPLVSPNQSDIQKAENQQAAANSTLLQAGQSYTSSKEQSQTSQDLSGIASSTKGAGNILPPVANSWYSQYVSNTDTANYWDGQIWQSYTYSCGTKKDPQTCTGTYYDSTAAANEQVYAGLANTDYRHYQEDEEQHAEMNGAASAQAGMSATAATQSAQDLAQAKAQQAQAKQLGAESGASASDAYAGVNSGSEASGSQTANAAIRQIDQKYQYTPSATAPALKVLSDGVNGQAIANSAPGTSQMATVEADDQSAENHQAREYVAQQQAQAAQQKDQQQASELEMKAEEAPTTHSREAWQEAADAAQAKAHREAQAAQAAIAAQKADQQQEQSDTQQASSLAQSASSAANSEATQQGNHWAQQQIQEIEANPYGYQP